MFDAVKVTVSKGSVPILWPANTCNLWPVFTQGCIHGSENHPHFTALSSTTLHLSSYVIFLINVFFKKSHGCCGRVPWLLGEGQELPWLLWHAHYWVTTKTMSGPTKSWSRILANQVKKSLNLAIWNPEKQKICCQFEKRTFTNVPNLATKIIFLKCYLSTDKSNTRPTLAHTKVHTTHYYTHMFLAVWGIDHLITVPFTTFALTSHVLGCARNWSF